mmetsp:Transcript_21433/g.44006  ORF Transcript_21433/g.44006 Transcript_21433/m.44006 type:complete len:280 (+) Transcript_21433:41-880(+)
MKSTSVLAVSSIAALPESSALMGSMTTEDLELSTTEFINRIGASKKYMQAGHRALRNYTTRRRGGKSDKTSGRSKSSKDDPKPPGLTELFYILPSGCPNQCVSSRVNRDGVLDNSLLRCNRLNEEQWWSVQADGAYVQVESYQYMGRCISIDYELGDSKKMLKQACEEGILRLKDCDSEYGTQWYFTGGQLISSMCWNEGISTYMTIFINDRNRCDSELSVWGNPQDALLRADTFMFVDELPESPFLVGGSPGDREVKLDDDDDDEMEPTISPTLALTF